MKIHVLGDGCLAETTRACSLPYHEFTDHDPDVLWCCVDTPINGGRGESKYVRFAIEKALDMNPKLVLISSQVPVGFCASMERFYPLFEFAVSPENIRVATPVQDFLNQARIVVGARRHHPELEVLLSPFSTNLIWMSPESAEMVKHAVNTYLAMCIRFGNELGTICDAVGADAGEVVEALRMEPRVSPKAPLMPGDGPSLHLMRDVHTMAAIGGPLFKALLCG